MFPAVLSLCLGYCLVWGTNVWVPDHFSCLPAQHLASPCLIDHHVSKTMYKDCWKAMICSLLWASTPKAKKRWCWALRSRGVWVLLKVLANWLDKKCMCSEMWITRWLWNCSNGVACEGCVGTHCLWWAAWYVGSLWLELCSIHTVHTQWGMTACMLHSICLPRWLPVILQHCFVFCWHISYEPNLSSMVTLAVTFNVLLTWIWSLIDFTCSHSIYVFVSALLANTSVLVSHRSIWFRDLLTQIHNETN